MINKQTKLQIVDAARQYMQNNGLSQDKFSELVKRMNGGAGFSVAYLNDMLKDKFTTGHKQTAIDDKYFMRIAKAINLSVRKSYRQHIDTDNYMQCITTFNDARESGLPHAIDGSTGDGKSYAAEEYVKQNPKNTYIVRCDGDLTAKSFFMELAHALGMNFEGPIYNIRKNVINKLVNEQSQAPLLIIDESENLKDRAWDGLKRIMDDLKGYCGIVFIGANEFENKLQTKAKRMKGCFPQVYRRIREGGFTQLFKMTLDDVSVIAKMYGIGNRDQVKSLFDNCQNIGELTAMLEKIMREHDNTNTSVETLIDLYCNVQRRMKAAA
jgi:DNA transposition AAA+ family ATPase